MRKLCNRAAVGLIVAFAISGCGSLPPPVGSKSVAWVKGQVEPASLSVALEAARARYPNRQITEKDLVRVSCSMDDISWYEGNAVAPKDVRLGRGAVVRIKVGTPLIGQTGRHLDEIVSIVAPPGKIPYELPRARNGKLIEYPDATRRSYVGSTGSTLALSCSADL